jgi:uncharacterized protein YkwD
MVMNRGLGMAFWHVKIASMFKARTDHSMHFKKRAGGASMAVCVLLSSISCDYQNASPLSAPNLLGPAASTSRSRSGACADVQDKSALIRQMVDAVNAERARHKLGALRPEPTLMQIADFYACRLAEGGFFSHEDPFGSSSLDTRAADFGYAFFKIGENLAAGQESVDEALGAWLASPSHRAILLDPAFTEIGVAVKAGGPNGIYWVQEFGRPITDGEETTQSSAPESTAVHGESASQPAPGKSGS